MAITKEKALDILEKFDFFQCQRAGRELWNDKPFDVQEEDLKNFARDIALLKDFINTIDVVPKNEWTSVDDKLPERKGRYLVHIPNEQLICCLYYDCDASVYGDNDVTHWMPLPEPPKMKGGK